MYPILKNPSSIPLSLDQFPSAILQSFRFDEFRKHIDIKRTLAYFKNLLNELIKMNTKINHQIQREAHLGQIFLRQSA